MVFSNNKAHLKAKKIDAQSISRDSYIRRKRININVMLCHLYLGISSAPRLEIWLLFWKVLRQPRSYILNVRRTIDKVPDVRVCIILLYYWPSYLNKCLCGSLTHGSRLFKVYSTM
jgi:hypothetical protein